jgi:hypothetical protein
MQFDRAMALLLSGQKVQRTTWIRPEKNTHLKIINDGNTSHAVADGVEIVFGRPIAFTNDIHISGRDMVACDWVVVATLSTSQSDPAPEIAALRAENERFRRVAERRDEFIIGRGLWEEFKEAACD